MKRRILSLVFVAMMLFGCFSVNTYADSYDYAIGDTTTTASATIQPTGNIPDNSVWTYVEEIKTWTCTLEENHSHGWECGAKCIWHGHVHNWNCYYWCPCWGHPTEPACGKVENHSHQEGACYTVAHKWILSEAYIVIWKDGDGTVLETDTNVVPGVAHEYNGVTPTKTADAQYEYTFAEAWEYPPALDEENRVVTYTAKFNRTERSYTVTWTNEDGTVLETDENVVYGTIPAYDGATPVKAADEKYTYTFKGWDAEIAAVTGDVTYKATYTATPIPVEKEDAPKTGDEANMMAWLILMAMAAAVGAVSYKRRDVK